MKKKYNKNIMIFPCIFSLIAFAIVLFIIYGYIYWGIKRYNASILSSNYSFIRLLFIFILVLLYILFADIVCFYLYKKTNEENVSLNRNIKTLLSMLLKKMRNNKMLLAFIVNMAIFMSISLIIMITFILNIDSNNSDWSSNIIIFNLIISIFSIVLFVLSLYYLLNTLNKEMSLSNKKEKALISIFVSFPVIVISAPLSVLLSNFVMIGYNDDLDYKYIISFFPIMYSILLILFVASAVVLSFVFLKKKCVNE